jgi:hypothetical protein
VPVPSGNKTAAIDVQYGTVDQLTKTDQSDEPIFHSAAFPFGLCSILILFKKKKKTNGVRKSYLFKKDYTDTKGSIYRISIRHCSLGGFSSPRARAGLWCRLGLHHLRPSCTGGQSLHCQLQQVLYAEPLILLSRYVLEGLLLCTLKSADRPYQITTYGRGTYFLLPVSVCAVLEKVFDYKSI